MQHFYGDNFAEKCLQGGSFSPIGYLCAFISLEFCLLVGINITYICKSQYDSFNASLIEFLHF